MVLDSERSIVVAIDMQGRLMDMVHRPELVAAATQRLLRIADLFGVPVVLTEQYPAGLGPTRPEILGPFEELAVPTRRVEKESFGCCGEPRFLEALTELRPGVDISRLQVVIAGIETHVCVVQTALELIERGAQVFVCWDCTSGRGAEYREWALRRMESAGARITNHESVAFEWARDKNHPSFKELNRLLREGQPG